MREETPERATVDTTVVVSAFIRRGIPSQVIQRWQASLVVLVVSAAIIAEYAAVLSRREMRTRYGIDREDVAAFLDDIRSRADLVTPPDELPLRSRDPKDDIFLACALAGGCRYLITGDSDLLVLAGHPALGSLRILTPRQFIEMGDAAAGR